MKHAHNVLWAALAVFLANGTAQATNGYFLPGSGFRSQGMGGVGIAYGRDSLSINANPANIVNTGMRGDMGFGVFNPERHAKIGEPASQLAFAKAPPGTNPALATFEPFAFNGAVESDAKYFLMPEMGMTMPINSSLSVGFAAIGNGGMNTTYPVNFFSYTPFNPDKPAKDTKVGVDMMQLLVPITAGYKLNDDHAIGGALVLAETRFRAYGLESFIHFDQFGIAPVTSAPNYLTGKGFDYSYGAGIKLGWLGEFFDDKLTLGLVYTSRTYMTKFDKYQGLFAEQGDFDIPENYGIGIAFKPRKNLVIAADVFHIRYNDIASIGNRGPGTSPGAYILDPNPQRGLPSFDDPSKELGNDNGMGFGWENQTVYKLGVQYGVNNRLQVRAGYNYGASPIPDDQLTFNVLAPATVEHHYSLGFTYRANENLEVTGTYMYVAPNSQLSPLKQNVVGAAEAGMHQNVFGLTMGWVLDPGPNALEEFGEEEWAGIDFSGMYAGFGFGQSKFRDVASSLNSSFASLGVTASTTVEPRAEGWKVYAGYEFNKYFGIEGGYANLNDWTASSTTNIGGPYVNKGDADAWFLTAVGTVPLTNKISILGKLGAAFVLVDSRLTDISNTNNTSTRTQNIGRDGYGTYYGAGVSYALLDNFNLRAEWERFVGNDIDIDLLTAGFAVKF